MVKRRTHRWGVPAALVVVFVLGAVPAAFGAMSPQQYRDKGDEFARNRLFIDAVDYYSRAIRTNKGEIPIEKVAWIFNSRGLAELQLNDRDRALDDFSNAINLNDRIPAFYVNRGRLYTDIGRYRSARDDFNRAIKLDPLNVDAYSGRGMASFGAKDYDQAAADFEQVVELDHRNTNAWYHLGLAYKNSGRIDKALTAFDRLLKIDPKYAAASYQKAGVYARQGKIDSACIWLQIAVGDGFRDWSALKDNADFDPIRRNPCYVRLLPGN